MYSQTKKLPSALAVAVGLFSGIPDMKAAEEADVAGMNKQLIQSSFDRWRSGTGGPFELLAADATWTITGNSVVAKKYASREEFMNSVINPFNARLAKPLIPVIRGIYSQGGTIIALFDGEATARDGKPYRNTYAWFMDVREGRIVSVTAFFDSIAFDEFWRRVAPAG